MCEYNDQVSVTIPDTVTLRYNTPENEARKTVSIDRCLVDEIKNLWGNGVVTHSCCCGHGGEFPAHIITDPNHRDFMIENGYVETQPNHFWRSK